MRRYARTLILIAVLLLLAGVVLGFQKIKIGNFERGGDTLLGLSLGLDLQGGSHLVYRAVDTETGEPIVPEEDKMESLKRSIEQRVNASGLGEPIIQRMGDDRLLIQLPGVRDPERAKLLIGETAQLVFKHRRLNVPRPLEEITEADIVGVAAGLVPAEEGESSAEGPTAELPPEAAPEAGGAEATEPEPEEERPLAILVDFTEEGAERFQRVLDRLNESLIQSLSTRVPPSRLDISVEGEQPLRFEAVSLSIQRVGETNQFAFALPQEQGTTPQDVEAIQAMLGDSPSIEFTEIMGAADDVISYGNLTGDDLARAYPGQHTGSGAPIINIEFNTRGAKIFGQLTEQIAGSPIDSIAIFLDEEELIAPVVQTAITSGAAIIQGRDFTIQRVRDLSLLLQAGSLPVSIDLIQERDVDAILGADSLSKSVVAGAVGLALVLLFMVLYYRVLGVVASVALMIYGVLLLATFKMFPIAPITLTLSGVAAVILSVGMAVDANILIFERMKDELRAGRTLLSAINIGFNRAWPAIRDSNVSTLITCGILFYFSNQLGTTIVQGFAATLAIGVLISMFSAITVSRTFLRVLATTPLARRLGMFVPAGGAELPQVRQTAAAVQRS